jgi:hypothetical protein
MGNAGASLRQSDACLMVEWRKAGAIFHAQRETPMKKFIALAAFAAAQWQPAYAQAIVGSIPEEFRGDWCLQENTKGEQIFRARACKPKGGSLSIERLSLDTGRLSCVFDSGTANDDTLKMRMHCSDSEEKQPSTYGVQLSLRPGKRIELIIEPMDQQ